MSIENTPDKLAERDAQGHSLFLESFDLAVGKGHLDHGTHFVSQGTENRVVSFTDSHASSNVGRAKRCRPQELRLHTYFKASIALQSRQFEPGRVSFIEQHSQTPL